MKKEIKNINAVIAGNIVNVSLGGKLYKKNCGTAEEADELFRLVLKAKADPTDENIRNVRAYLNERLRVAYLTGLENDPETGEVFLAGFITPLPEKLLEVIKKYHEKGYPMDAVINFWKLLMLNPDERVRASLFDFVTTHDFVLTDKGYMVVYKAVTVKKGTKNDELAEFVSEQFLYVKKQWKCSPKKYVVYVDNHNESLAITKNETIEKWGDKNITVLGNLGELFDAIYNNEDAELSNFKPVYTDKHTNTMDIVLGVPVKQERKDCDSNPAEDCSNGLHVGATKYVESFGKENDTILVCFVNPAHVVAVPTYDHSKMRVCEYFPYAIAEWKNKKINVIEEEYFEDDYVEYEESELAKMVAKIQANEKPIASAKKAKEETRSLSELKKIIEARLVDLQ